MADGKVVKHTYHTNNNFCLCVRIDCVCNNVAHVYVIHSLKLPTFLVYKSFAMLLKFIYDPKDEFLRSAM